MVFIEMENRQKYITLMFKLVLKMSHLHLAILAFSPIFGHLKLTYMVTLFLIFTHHTLFENCLKSRISILSFLDFPPIFVLQKVTCLVTLLDHKLQVTKIEHFWHF